MFGRFISVSLFAILVMLTGCATRTKMAFESDDGKLTEKSKPVFLMTATIKNTYKTSWQPKLKVVNVEKANAKDATDRLNFTMDEKAKAESDDPAIGSNYFLRLELDPGNYEIVGMSSLASTFPINAFFFAPLHAGITVGEPGVYYLGHVNATVRERQGDEFKAGPSIPLIDQAIAGASGGTFEIEVIDDFVKDEALFRSKFNALAGVKITKALLPTFDRAKAQAWWQAH
ncbi:hypothetical protein [Rhodoferax sp. GW822-FHT02A01]|uniref:hypothetical protein n=1 Tax=Rhodoferax sp. GW822-FHT02A01 TaxID=3141537 RepID=UPI00315C9612